MDKTFEKLKTLYSKYKNLKQYQFTHILSIGTYVIYSIICFNFLFEIIIFHNLSFTYFVLSYMSIFYTFLIIISVIIGFVHRYKKIKIINSYLLTNNKYNIFWNIGNFLFLIFIISGLIYLINLWGDSWIFIY